LVLPFPTHLQIIAFHQTEELLDLVGLGFPAYVLNVE